MSPCPHIIIRDGADYCAVAESTVATLRARLNATESMLAAQNREHLYTLLANGDLMQERDELRARAEAAEAKCAELIEAGNGLKSIIVTAKRNGTLLANPLSPRSPLEEAWDAAVNGGAQ